MNNYPEKTEVIMLVLCILLFAALIFAKNGLDRKTNRNAQEADAGQEVMLLTAEEKTDGEGPEMQQGTGGEEAKGQQQGTDEGNLEEQQRQTMEEHPDIQTQRAGNSAAAVQTGQNDGSGQYPPIRVLIKTNQFAGYYHDTIILSGNSALHVNQDQYVAAPGEVITITADCQWFTDGKLTVVPEDTASGTAVQSLNRSQGVPWYEGGFEIYLTDQGLILINELDLEAYLRYVVPSEMPSAYGAEALKAQAVCARTYAVRQMENEDLSAYHAHVDDSVSYQVYNNISRTPQTDQAVADTAGQIMMWEGEPITAYFFSTSCGHTSTDEVWNPDADTQYLKSVYLGADAGGEVETEEAFASFITSRDANNYEAADGWYRWKVTLPIAYLNERADEFGVGSIIDMRVLKRSEGGAVECLEITGTNGSHTLENEYEIRSVFSTRGYEIEKNDGTVTDSMTLMPSACFIFQQEKENGETVGYTFIGGGYGHGVGMSQNGAAHLAENGMGYEEILHFFYNDIEISTYHFPE